MELKFEKDYIKEKAEREFAPSVEFLDGEKPFGYSFKFSSGEKFNAAQSNGGGGTIIIERRDKKILILPVFFRNRRKNQTL